MERSLSRAFVVGVTASMIWALPAAAKSRGDREVRSLPTTNELVDQADARIAVLKADLRLTTDEEKNWGGFQSAAHDIAVNRIDEWNNLLKQRTAASSATPESPATTNGASAAGTPDTSVNAEPQNPASGTTSGAVVAQNTPNEIHALRDEADGFSRRADDLKKFADAAQPLFSGLDDPQRRRLMVFIRSNEADAQHKETAITANSR